jgi:hypothetical protein
MTAGAVAACMEENRSMASSVGSDAMDATNTSQAFAEDSAPWREADASIGVVRPMKRPRRS